MFRGRKRLLLHHQCNRGGRPGCASRLNVDPAHSLPQQRSAGRNLITVFFTVNYLRANFFAAVRINTNASPQPSLTTTPRMSSCDCQGAQKTTAKKHYSKLMQHRDRAWRTCRRVINAVCTTQKKILARHATSGVAIHFSGNAESVLRKHGAAITTLFAMHRLRCKRLSACSTLAMHARDIPTTQLRQWQSSPEADTETETAAQGGRFRRHMR